MRDCMHVHDLDDLGSAGCGRGIGYDGTLNLNYVANFLSQIGSLQLHGNVSGVVSQEVLVAFLNQAALHFDGSCRATRLRSESQRETGMNDSNQDARTIPDIYQPLGCTNRDVVTVLCHNFRDRVGSRWRNPQRSRLQMTLVHLGARIWRKHNFSATRQLDLRLGRGRLNGAAFEKGGIAADRRAIQLEIAGRFDYTNGWRYCHQEEQAAAGQERKKRPYRGNHGSITSGKSFVLLILHRRVVEKQQIFV